MIVGTCISFSYVFLSVAAAARDDVQLQEETAATGTDASALPTEYDEGGNGQLGRCLDLLLLLLLAASLVLRLRRHRQLVRKGLLEAHSWQHPNHQFLSSVEYVGNFCSFIGTTLTFSLRPSLVFYSLGLSLGDAFESAHKLPVSHAMRDSLSRPAYILSVFVATKVLAYFGFFEGLGIVMSYGGCLLAFASTSMHLCTPASPAATRVPLRERWGIVVMIVEKLCSCFACLVYLGIVLHESSLQSRSALFRWWGSVFAQLLAEASLTVGLAFRAQTWADRGVSAAWQNV